MSNSVIDIVGKISKHEHSLHKSGADSHKERFLNWFFFIGIIAPCFCSIILAVISVIIQSEYTKIAALLSLVIAYFSAIAMPIVSMTIYRASLILFFTDPLTPQLRNASIAIEASNHFLPALTKCSQSELKLAGMELKTERDALEKRVGLIVGAIDKVGLGPGLVTLMIGLIKVYEWLLKVDGSEEIKGIEWYLGIALALLVFYIMGLTAHNSILKIDRALKLVDLAISKKKLKATTIKPD